MTRKITLFIAALFLCGAMQAQNYHWSYNYHDYESNFPLIGEVYINGEVVASSDFEIAAFVGDQVRATEFLFEADPVNFPGHYYAWLGVSYNNAGETVTFKLYDHSTGTEHDNCSTTVLTNANGYGEIDDPVIIEFTVETPISYGPEYPWIPGSYENFMYMETQIQINGVPVTNTNWEVGAFCGEECRGLGDADNWWVSQVDQSNIMEIVVGGATGDVINFYLYDVTNQEVYPAICAVTLDWIDDDIGDMFEPFVLNFETSRTFTKDITAYSGNGGYYLIASPIGEVAPTDVQNMTSNNFDLYYFDQTKDLEWINYEGSDGNFNLVAGKGYLYANSENVTLTFTGFPYSGDGKVTLTKNGIDFPGWNLIGNPFATAATLNMPFYKMNAAGDGFTPKIEDLSNTISAMEGVFVQAAAANQTATFTPQTSKGGRQSDIAKANLNVIGANGKVIDNAIVRFDEGQTLEKFMLHADGTKIFFTEGNKDYAIVRSNGQGETPVSFKAAENGTYTIDFSMDNVEFNYLHLIDNKTGNDIDLLATPSYSFEARTTDYASRFRLVFRANANTAENNNETFAFFSNGNWIIDNDGQATLQVIDVNGRILSSEQVNGCVSKRIEAAPGVYMLRLINGSNVKMQKIVVR